MILCKIRNAFPSFSLVTRVARSQASVTERSLSSKAPAHGFAKFMAEQRASVVASNPDASFGEISKLVGSKWRALSAEKKQEFQDEYQREKKAYLASMTDEQLNEQKMAKLKKSEAREKRKQKKMQSENNMPRRPAGSFVQFTNSIDLGDTPTQAMAGAAMRWRQMAEEDKKVFKDKFEEAQKEYNKEMEKWSEKMYKEGHSELIPNLWLQKVKRMEKERK